MCEIDTDDESIVECIECEDTGAIVVAGVEIECPNCDVAERAEVVGAAIRAAVRKLSVR